MLAGAVVVVAGAEALAVAGWEPLRSPVESSQLSQPMRQILQ
jgi:hypothetical protein